MTSYGWRRGAYGPIESLEDELESRMAMQKAWEATLDNPTDYKLKFGPSKYEPKPTK